MTEFVNRMACQRRLLSVVNSRWWVEELFGLSQSAIDRWMQTNHLDPGSTEVSLVREAAEALRFLAVQSQEQVSPEYERVAADVDKMIERCRVHFLGTSSECASRTQVSSDLSS